MAADLRIYNRINREITAPEVRIVGAEVENKVYSLDEALSLAAKMELDLVEISDKSTPPVCRIVDYNKFLYEQKKKQKEIKSKSVKQILKEIRFGPNTDEHDIDFKLKHAIKFLEEGSKIKAYVHFRGRTIIHTERGATVLQRFLEGLEEYGKVEKPPVMEGKRMIVFIIPKGKK
ncbi:MAG: translation initiation factor IF-3 [Bacteroidetes bacterium]|nr:translation initiation factor IF-3 [Bacteroidota bacterium]